MIVGSMKFKQKYFPSIRKLNNVYHSMMSRCYNKNTRMYKFYGGRGVIVCEEWKNDYQKFLDWALGNGWKEGVELDKDTKGDGMLYSPETCCFVTSKKNQRSRRHLLKFEYNGTLSTLADICESLGLNSEVVRQRIQRDKMSFAEAISRPTGVGKTKKAA